jgi:hypothetical protein
LAPAEKRSIELKQGKVVAMVGKQPVHVKTNYGSVQIAGNSAAIIQQNANGVVRVANLSGQATDIQVTRNGKVQTMTANAGEELVIADEELADEEMIAIDGVDREPIEGAITMPGLKVNKSKFDQKMMLEKERLLVCNAGSFFRMKTKVDKLKQKVNASAQPLKHTFTPPSGPKAPAKPLLKSEATPAAGDGAPMRLLTDGTHSVVPYFAIEGLVTATADDDDVETLKPVAFAQSSTGGVNGALRTFSGGTALIKHNGKADFATDNQVVNLKSGEILVCADKDTVVKTGACQLNISGGTIALIANEGGIIKVRNLWEMRAGTIREIVGDKFFDVAAGQETIISPDEAHLHQSLERDQIGRRKARMLDIPGGLKLSRSELSMVSLIQNTDMLSVLVNSENSADKALAGKLIKMAAVLTQVTARHGQYMNVKK